MKKYNRIVYYYDSFSIAVINQSGKLRRLYTPFIVKCINSIDDIQENSCVYVDEVFKDPDDLLLYKIGGNIYSYDHFTIKINY